MANISVPHRFFCDVIDCYELFVPPKRTSAVATLNPLEYRAFCTRLATFLLAGTSLLMGTLAHAQINPQANTGGYTTTRPSADGIGTCHSSNTPPASWSARKSFVWAGDSGALKVTIGESPEGVSDTALTVVYPPPDSLSRGIE